MYSHSKFSFFFKKKFQGLTTIKNLLFFFISNKKLRRGYFRKKKYLRFFKQFVRARRRRRFRHLGRVWLTGTRRTQTVDRYNSRLQSKTNKNASKTNRHKNPSQKLLNLSLYHESSYIESMLLLDSPCDLTSSTSSSSE